MIKYLPILIIVIAFGIIVFPAYSQTTLTGLCYDGVVLAVFQLNPVLECLDTRIIEVNNSITGGTDDTVCTNVGSGSQVYKDGECNFRTLLGSSDISITNSSNTITIDFNGTGGGETTVCNNVGTGNPIHKVGTNCSAFSLIAGTGISITNTTDDYTLANTLPEATTGSNLGTFGSAVFSSEIGNDLQFKRLNSLDFCLTIPNNSTNVNFNISCQKEISSVYVSLLKSNIGTAYVDIYVTAFDIENIESQDIDCDFTQFKIIWSWDVVGTGSHQVRWVDVASQDVFYEAPAFTLDRDGQSSGWINKPSYCDNVGFLATNLEWQGKSTVASDDPVAKGYKIMVR